MISDITFPLKNIKIIALTNSKTSKVRYLYRLNFHFSSNLIAFCRESIYQHKIIIQKKYEILFSALIKDNGRNYSSHLKAIVLFHSTDGIHWEQLGNSCITREFTLSDGSVVEYDRVERPQILFQNGEATTLFCGVKPNGDEHDSFNIQIPIKFNF